MVNCQNSQLADALDAELATFARRAPGLRHVTTITWVLSQMWTPGARSRAAARQSRQRSTASAANWRSSGILIAYPPRSWTKWSAPGVLAKARA